jgi:hypothetical protein
MALNKNTDHGQRSTRSSSATESELSPNEIDEGKVNFVEPELADNIIVTGQKIEDFPTVKIKKELGAFVKGSKNIQESPELIEKFNSYKNSLQNQEVIENSTTLSTLRSSLKRSNSPSSNILKSEQFDKKIKKKPTKRKNNNNNNNNNNNLLLNLSNDITKSIDDSVSPSPAPLTPNSNNDPTALNNDYCSCCGMTGMFLCCESCPKSYHFQCINPPIDPNNLPDFWYCKECIKKKSKINNKDNGKSSILLNVGIFAKLFDNIIYQDPISFQLPKEIIESFQGISSDRLGDYNDDSFKPIKSYKQLVKEFDDPLNGIYDNNSNPYLCYKCGESGLDKEIIHCDYCPLSWHLDCLDIPLTNVKKLGSKWKCNNHIDDLSNPIRIFKDQTIIQVTNIKNFEKSGKLPINAKIEIINIEDKLKALKEQIKILHNNNNSNLKFSNLTFQINEEDIILDFINSSKIKKLNEDEKSFQSLMNLKPDLKDYIYSLNKLSGKSLISNEIKNINLQKLLKVSDEELKLENQDFSKDELKEFLMIKRLIEEKGKDKLLEFLTTS